jgi:bifunctional non-homologous end joining protein LigD
VPNSSSPASATDDDVRAVATPLTWKELSPDIDPRSFTVDMVVKRLNGLKADPWKGFDKVRQSVP